MTETKIIGTIPLGALASMITLEMHYMKNQEVHAAATHMLEVEESRVPKSDTALTASMVPAALAISAPVNPTPASVVLVNPAPTPVAAIPIADSQVTPPDNTPAIVPVAATPAYTVEQIGRAGVDLVSQDAAKMPELLMLLQKYGVQAITQLKSEQLGAFATELWGLGAKL